MQHGSLLGALEQQCGLRLRLCKADGGIEQRLIWRNPFRLDAAGGSENEFRSGIINPDCQFLRREAAMSRYS
jgi:hypothetical protein